jgi:hypothetical protein
MKVEHTRIRAGRPQTNGNVEALHRTILEECWRPSFARYLHPGAVELAARPRMSRQGCRHILESVHAKG